MRYETGIITKIANDMAQVEPEQNLDCDSCTAKSACIVLSGSKKRKIWIENIIQADIGDRIIFSIEEKGVVMSSFLLYLFPVIMLFAGIIIGANVHDLLLIDGDLTSGLFGLIGLGISFVIIRIISIFIKKNPAFMPVMIGFANKNNLN